jgi:GPH family glycoside/pentoside/hexuronide:cation symporter
MKNLLDTISPYADTVRLFGCTGELEKIYPVLKAAPYKKRVIGGCWFDARYSEKQIQNELDTLIKLTNEGYIDIAVVGSENLHRSDFSAAQMIEYIDYVRAGIKDKSIPVTTSDTASALLANPQVIEHCNVVLFTQYSYYEKIDVSQSVKSLQNSYDALKALAGEKPIIVSETGFPTSGSTNGKAVPSMKNAKVFADAVYDWSRKSNIEVVLFSSVDEAYKKANGDVEDHFGIFTADGEAKSAYKDLLAKSK